MTYIVEITLEVARHLEDALRAPDAHGYLKCALCKQCVEWIVRETKSPGSSPHQQGHYTPPPPYVEHAPLDDPGAQWQPPVALLREGPQS